MPLKIDNSNYAVYKSVFEILSRHLTQGMVLSPDAEPVTVLNKIEKEKPSVAARSLKMGISDSIAWLKHQPAAFEPIDKALREKKLPHLSKLIAAVNDTINKVLRRGIVRNLQEYYIVAETLSDVENGLGENDNYRLSELLRDFEKKKK